MTMEIGSDNTKKEKVKEKECNLLRDVWQKIGDSLLMGDIVEKREILNNSAFIIVGARIDYGCNQRCVEWFLAKRYEGALIDLCKVAPDVIFVSVMDVFDCLFEQKGIEGSIRSFLRNRIGYEEVAESLNVWPDEIAEDAGKKIIEKFTSSKFWDMNPGKFKKIRLNR